MKITKVKDLLHLDVIVDPGDPNKSSLEILHVIRPSWEIKDIRIEVSNLLFSFFFNKIFSSAVSLSSLTFHAYHRGTQHWSNVDSLTTTTTTTTTPPINH